MNIGTAHRLPTAHSTGSVGVSRLRIPILSARLPSTEIAPWILETAAYGRLSRQTATTFSLAAVAAAAAQQG